MKEIIVKTQAEIDALPKSFKEFTRVLIRSSADIWVSVNFKIENCNIEARGSSHVEARGSSHVVAWGSSHVEAWGSSHVEARGSSHVEARESSHVEARESVSISCQSEFSTLVLFGFAVAVLVRAAKSCVKESKTATVVKPKQKRGTAGWLGSQGVESKSGNVVLFKRVSSDFKTQEKTSNETIWALESKIEHPSWNPKVEECGTGKFHACSRPFFCDEFRSDAGDKYIAIEIKVADLYAWPNPKYPHKVAFRAGKILFECDRYGNKI